MASSSLTFRLFGVDVDASRKIHAVGDEADRAASKIDKLGRGFSPLLTAATALGPALIPALAGATAAAGGLGVAVASGGAALGVFGAVAKESFKDIQDNLKAAAKGTENLTGPIGQATASYVAMTGAWDNFVEKNQPQVFRIMGAGFSTLSSAIPKLQPLFDVAAEAVARLEGQLIHFTTTGGLDHLVGFLSSNARPALEAFRQTLTNLFTGVGALAPQFARFSGGVEVGLVHLSAAFAQWAQGAAGPGGGFQKFFNYVIATAPDILSTFKTLAGALVNIAQGFAPLGPVSLTFVGTMAKLISVLPPSAITALATGFLGVQGALKVAAAASQLFNRSIGATPIGLIAVGLSALIGVLTHHAQAVAESRAQTEQFRDTLDKTTAAITLDTRAMAAHELQTSGALDAAMKLGLGLATITDAAVGNKTSLDQVNATIADTHNQFDTALKSGQGVNKTLNDQEAAATKLGKQLSVTTGQVSDAQDKQRQLNAATKPTTVAILSQKDAAIQAHRALEQLSASLLKTAGINLTAEQSAIQFKNSLADLTQSVKDNGHSLDINTAKGRANRSAVLDSISAALQHADAVGKQTGSQTKAQKAFQDSIPQIERQATKLGLNKKAVDALIHSIGGLRPKTVDVGVVVKGSNVVLSGSRVSVATAGGGRAIRQTGQADGGVLRSFASGGEHHVAQIARPGDWRVWAEPETGGEAYIPLARSKRSRSTAILRNVAGSFGFGLIPAADGTVLNGGSIGHLTGTFNSMVNSAAVSAARAAVQSLINAGRLTVALSIPGAPGNVSANAALGRSLAASLYGWTGPQWNALFALGQRESGWNNNAQNPTSTAYGIGQLLNSTWANTGIAKTSNPGLQIVAMLRYIAGRYLNPLNAWGHETSFGWYGNGTPPGGLYFPSPAVIGVGERGGETVTVARGRGTGAGMTVNIYVQTLDPGSAGRVIRNELRDFLRTQGKATLANQL